jgi:enoyl-CoA hydratase/carnithine racemase
LCCGPRASSSQPGSTSATTPPGGSAPCCRSSTGSAAPWPTFPCRPSPRSRATPWAGAASSCSAAICRGRGRRATRPAEIKLAAIAPGRAAAGPARGRRVAADLLFGGEPLDAAAAREAGLLNAVVAPDELDGWVARKAAQLAGLSAVALRHTKRALAAGTGDWAAALPALERLYLDELMASADAREGLAAFLDKRAAVWTHR